MGGPAHSAAFSALVAQWRLLRAEYDLYLEAAYDAALEGCSGVLLNERGRRAGIDARSLFMGQRARAYAYASEELRDWWDAHPRVTFQDFEAQHTDAPGRSWGA